MFGATAGWYQGWQKRRRGTMRTLIWYCFLGFGQRLPRNGMCGFIVFFVVTSNFEECVSSVEPLGVTIRGCSCVTSSPSLRTQHLQTLHSSRPCSSCSRTHSADGLGDDGHW